MNGLEIYPEILSKESCEKIIDGFKKDTNKQRGRTAVRCSSDKISTDIYCSAENDKFSFYTEIISPALYACCDNIKRDYPFLIDQCNRWRICSNYNIQYYSDGEGYYSLHNEHSYTNPYRMMAWMIYLNDAESGTEFPYQNTIVQAKQGQAVVWSAEWTHPHKGVTPNIGDKYIVTGWFEYYGLDPRNR